MLSVRTLAFQASYASAGRPSLPSYTIKRVNGDNVTELVHILKVVFRLTKEGHWMKCRRTDRQGIGGQWA